jgi:density-regulated protein DRP1
MSGSDATTAPPQVAVAYPSQSSGATAKPESGEDPAVPAVPSAYPSAPGASPPAEVPAGEAATKPVTQMKDRPPIEGPDKVEYCSKSGIPAEYLEFFPEFAGIAGLSLEEKSKSEKSAAGEAEGKPKLLPGGKTKKEEVKQVVVKTALRNKRKTITVVAGLDTFGVKLDKATKVFSKKFSCGCSVAKGIPGGKADEIEIQGDFADAIVEVILANFKEVPKDKITFEK